MKNIIKRYLPRPALELALWAYSLIIRLYDQAADFHRYAKFAMRSEHAALGLTDHQLEAQITRDYHRIEKGLALHHPKRPFGADLLHRLDSLLPVAAARAPEAAFVKAAESAREALLAWNSGGQVNDAVSPPANDWQPNMDIAEFFYSRHSVRDFSETPVDDGVLRKAVELARLSPSVCNRQPWLVRLYRDKEAREILRYQNGNQGFRDSVPAVALVTVELGHFVGSHERNQAWIEGGIFSTSLMWALHGLGLSTCMLNLSLKTRETNRLRAAANIPASEVPIMMLAIGYPRRGHRVARSPRRDVAQVIAK